MISSALGIEKLDLYVRKESYSLYYVFSFYFDKLFEVLLK